MNRNRMLIGLTVAVVVGLFLSTYVYRAFKNASAVKPFIAPAHRGGGDTAATRHARGCEQPAVDSMAFG